MKAPDKIYLKESNFCPGEAMEIWFSLGDKEDACYMRMDLLTEFADIVRRYVAPTRDDKFCSRSELMQALAKFNEIIQ